MEVARRLAKTAFDLYCSEGEFAYGVGAESTIPKLKEAFEELGCTVEVHSFKPELLIKCPEPQQPSGALMTN